MELETKEIVVPGNDLNVITYILTSKAFAGMFSLSLL